MAQGIILIIMSLSLVTAGMSARALILELRKVHRQLYGTMNFDVRTSRSSKLLILTNAVVCVVSLVLLACSLMIYQFIHFPVL
jgi:hypothetical protein